MADVIIFAAEMAMFFSIMLILNGVIQRLDKKARKRKRARRKSDFSELNKKFNNDIVA